MYIIAGPEFGPEREGKALILYNSMYGARTSCARFHEHLAAKLLALGLTHPKLILTYGTETKATIMNMWLHILMIF